MNTDQHNTECEHEQVHIQVRDWHAEVDVGMAPLIAALWWRRIRTLWSCQEAEPARGRAWEVDPAEPRVFVAFATTDDLVRLLKQLPKGNDVYDSAVFRNRWEYTLVPMIWRNPHALACNIPLPDGLRVQVNADIPRSDVPGIIKALMRWLP